MQVLDQRIREAGVVPLEPEWDLDALSSAALAAWAMQPSSALLFQEPGAYGEGGLVTTDDDLALQVRMIRDHGSERRYYQLLHGAPVVTPAICQDSESVYHLYVIRAPRRGALQAWLREHGVAFDRYCPVSVHSQQAMGSLGYRAGDLPVTERVVTEILSLPRYA